MSGAKRSRVLGLPLAAIVLAGALGACGGSEDPGDRNGKGRGNVSGTRQGQVKATVDWDLRHGHSVKQVKWRGSNSFEVGGGVKVRLKLPGGIVTQRVDRFGADRDGDEIRDVVLYWPGDSIDGAYARVKQLAKAWRLDTANLDAWHRKLKANPGRPADLPGVIANPAGMKPTAPGGPIPSAEIKYSFDTTHPAMVKLQFFWQPS